MVLRTFLFLALFFAGISGSTSGGEVLVDGKGVWRVFRQGGTVPVDWAAGQFEDRAWPSATGLDFAQGASVGLGRLRFQVANRAAVERLELRVRYRDGLVVFLNGVEWLRGNMPPGFIDASTPALSRRAEPEAKEFEKWEADGALLREGENVIAVALHPYSEDSSPLSAELTLSATRLGVDAAAPAHPTIGQSPPRNGRVVVFKSVDLIAAATPEDWKVTAFAMEERALQAYARRDWKNAAAHYVQGQLAYAFAFRGAVLVAPLKGYLLSRSKLSGEFLDLLSPHDDHRNVFSLLNTLHQHAPDRFEAFPRLAMAIALVYDQGPPRAWPHNQVSRTALPRRLPDPLEAFDFWVRSDREGKTFYDLDALLIEELKYVVDVVAPFAELEWAQREIRPELNSIEKLYWSVRYDAERYANRQTKWSGDDYRLETIRERGGICSDQAYFMTQIAKAHGVPCITVTGIVEEGLHAWVGYMEAPGKWSFRAGRNFESSYVAGRAFDPQSWRRPMDHELAFLKERLALQARYRLSLLHSSFARLAMREGDLERAATAAKNALGEDKRNRDAWELLIDVTEGARGEGWELEVETLCRNGARAFRDYPDLEAGFLRRLARLLESRGDSAGAQRVRREVIRKHHRERPDLALAEAARELHVAMREASLDEQVELFRREVFRFRRAGLITGHRMVEPFVHHLIDRDESVLARAAIRYARERLEVGIPEQLERMLASLERRLGS